MITAKGIGVLLTAALVLILAIVTRVGWLLLFDAVLWGVISLSALLPWLTMGKLRGRRRAVGWEGDTGFSCPTEGEAVEFELDFQNRGVLPIAFGTVDYNLGGVASQPSHQRLFVAWMGRAEKTSRTARTTYQIRGRRRLVPMVSKASDPFGLFRRRRRLGEVADLLVIPKVHPVSRPQVAGLLGRSAGISRPARAGNQVAGSRNYLPGDPSHHLHWRNTARTGQPQVREFETEADQSITICFDGSLIGVSREGSDELYEDSIRIAASIGVAACRSGTRTRVISGDYDFSTADANRLLESLAVHERSGKSTLTDHLERSGDGPTIAITSPENLQGLASAPFFHMSGGGHTVFAMVGYDVEGLDGHGPEFDEAHFGVRTILCRRGDIGAALSCL